MGNYKRYLQGMQREGWMRFHVNNSIKEWSIFFFAGIVLYVYPAGAQTSLHVTVSIPPQKYFVEKIGGDLVDVTVMVPAGAEPHTYEPKPRQLIDISKSAVYCAIGIAFDQTWLNRFRTANPRMLVVHTDKGIQKKPVHMHGEERENESGRHHEYLDPHIWLSPPLVKKQAEHIYGALVKTDPGNKEIYRRNYDAFLKELDELDEYLKNVFKEKGGELRFMVFHPSWGYFAREYGLEQIPVELEGKEPKPADLMKLIDTAKQFGIDVVFVQPQFSEKSARTITEAIDGEIVIADPLSEDWDRNLRNVAQQFIRNRGSLQ